IHLNPLLPGAYCGRGIAREAKGDREGAIDDYTKAIEIDPAFSDARMHLAEVLKAKAGHFPTAGIQSAAARN
ncbi:MAG: tetratricopeptide repeat protein, partial [Acidobacteriota bacterium]